MNPPCKHEINCQVEGNTAGKCSKCRKAIKSYNGITGLHCRWCHMKVHSLIVFLLTKGGALHFRLSEDVGILSQPADPNPPPHPPGVLGKQKLKKMMLILHFRAFLVCYLFKDFL